MTPVMLCESSVWRDGVLVGCGRRARYIVRPAVGMPRASCGYHFPHMYRTTKSRFVGRWEAIG